MVRFYAAFIHKKENDQPPKLLLVKKEASTKWEIPIGTFRGDTNLNKIMGVHEDFGLECRLHDYYEHQTQHNGKVEIYFLNYQRGNVSLTENYKSYIWISKEEIDNLANKISNNKIISKYFDKTENAIKFSEMSEDTPFLG